MAPHRRILICGTGRAGTTLLVRILGSAGLDTGFDDADKKTVEARIGKAGLERGITARNAKRLPLVVKSPLVVDVLPKMLSENWLNLGLAIVPVRELWAAAESRRRVRQKAIESGIESGSAPGGLWKTQDGAQQESVLAHQFYHTVQPLVAANVPLKLISFPRFANDEDYFIEMLGAVLEQSYGVSEQVLRAAYKSEVNEGLISIKQ
jgi:hypothetical protein